MTSDYNDTISAPGYLGGRVRLQLGRTSSTFLPETVKSVTARQDGGTKLTFTNGNVTLTSIDPETVERVLAAAFAIREGGAR